MLVPELHALPFHVAYFGVLLPLTLYTIIVDEVESATAAGEAIRTTATIGIHRRKQQNLNMECPQDCLRF